MPTPLISVIMPAFNTGKYIREAIDSVLNQTEQDFELIIINDGSTDDTEAIVRSYNSDKIRYHANPKNLGLSKSRNRASDLARGEFIALADSDDVQHHQWLSIQADYLRRHPHVGVVAAKSVHFNSSSPVPFPQPSLQIGKVKAFKRYSQKTHANVVFNGTGISNNTAMIRASVLTQHHLAYDADLPVVEDYDFFKRLGWVTDMVVLDYVSLLSRQRPESISKNIALNHQYYAVANARFLQDHFGVDISPFYDTAGAIKIDQYGQLNDAVEKIIRSKIDNPRFNTETIRRDGIEFMYRSLRATAKKTADYRLVYAAYQQSSLLRRINLSRKIRIHIKHLRFRVVTRWASLKPRSKIVPPSRQ